jgi:hypothetical protein
MREPPILVPDPSKREVNRLATREFCPLHTLISTTSSSTDNRSPTSAYAVVSPISLGPEHSSIKFLPRSSCQLFIRWPICRPDSRDKWLLDLCKSRPPELDSAFPNSPALRCRCAPCSQRPCRRFRPSRRRRSVHVVPHLLGRLGWARWDLLGRTARQVCSDLRGGSRATNQHDSSDKRLRQCYGNK